MFFFLDKTTRIYHFRLLAKKNAFAVELKNKKKETTATMMRRKTKKIP